MQEPRRARPVPRLLPSLAVVVLGLALAALNLVALGGDVQLRAEGTRVAFHIDRCVANGRSRACSGSYRVAGVGYVGRLFLGGGTEQAGQTVPALVRHAGDDASSTGLAGSVEAALLALGGTVVAAVGLRRAYRARTAPSGPAPEIPPGSAPRSWRARARVWEAGRPDGDDP